ncbi:MAG: hypothetical protein LIO78_02545 [Clostridiales bacterium]|nr:hypothetical protein [Clostridiales bacterium]MCD8188719.1 hypothetical protein [Clostridiales bacterium]
MKNGSEVRIYTTHNSSNLKPKYMCKPMIINGRRALGYEKDGKVDHYISMDEVNHLMDEEALPVMKLDF